MTLDARARATATNLLAKFGKVVSYVRAVPPAYDPNSTGSAPSDTAYTVNALVEGFPMGAGTNPLILMGDLRVSIAGADIAFAPAIGDKVTIDAVTYTVMTPPVPTFSGELVALWRLQVRK